MVPSNQKMVTSTEEDGHARLPYRQVQKRWACASTISGIIKKNYDKTLFQTERAFNAINNMILKTKYELSGINRTNNKDIYTWGITMWSKKYI